MIRRAVAESALEQLLGEPPEDARDVTEEEAPRPQTDKAPAEVARSAMALLFGDAPAAPPEAPELDALDTLPE